MMKKTVVLILAVLLSFSLFSCVADTDKESVQDDKDIEDTAKETDEKNEENEENEDERESTSTPLLYKVTDSDGDVIWLFGSIHVGKEEFYPLPDTVMEAYENSDALAVEFDVEAFQNDMGAMTKALMGLIYRDGTTVKDHMPKELYESAVEILKENGYYSSVLDYYDISLWSSFVDDCSYEQIGVNTELGIDMHLLKRAKDDGKDIYDIESAELQLGIFAELSMDTQLYLLEASIEGYEHLDELEAGIEELMDIWASGDEESLVKYLKSEIPDDPEEKKCYEEYTNAIETERNQSMTEYAVGALEDGKELFICVGAAHIVGEGAMAENLRELGYTVEKVG